ncbi:MAG TPA: PAS domain S-box protein, partial [Anaerolineales bacterium]|nr:PAS domain S-box protein [Anaerolineales bacterium]
MPRSSRDRNSLPEALAVFLEMSFDAAVVFDAHECITYWNLAARQIFGWTAQEALGKTPAKLFLPVNTPEEKKDRQQRQSRLKRDETLRGEQECCRKDGSSLRVQYTARAFFNAEGKFGGSLAIYRAVPALVTGQADATERRLASDLRARTEEIEALLNVSPVAIFVAHDPECTRITGNPAGYRLVELPEQANISKSAPDEERPTYRTFRNGVEVSAEDLPMQKAARLGMEISEDVLELLFENGSRKFIYAFAKPLFDAQGQSRGAVAAMLDISERKRAEEKLEKSNQKLQEILASIQDDFYVIDHSWVFVYANRQFTSKLGKEPEDLIGNNVWEMFPKHIATALGENFRAAMEKREMRRFEISGQYTNAWYGVTVFPSTEGITVLGTDITESKRAADALRRSEARLRQMIETSLVAIGLGDSTGKIFDANEAFYRLTGYSREEIQSSQLGWNQLTAPEYAELDRQMIATLVATGSAGPYEKEYIRKDGSRLPLLLTMSELPGRDEHIAFIIDITERKRTENALAQALQELRMHIDNSPLAVIAFDPEFRVTEWSAGAERMFGWSAEEVLN